MDIKVFGTGCANCRTARVMLVRFVLADDARRIPRTLLRPFLQGPST